MKSQYWQASRSPIYGLIAVLPLFVLYELLIWLTGTNLRNGAEALLVRALPFSDLNIWIIKLVVVIALAALFIWRAPDVKLNRNYFGLLFIEATVYSLLLGGVVIFLLRGLSLMTLADVGVPLQFPSDSNLLTNLMLSFGAGLYEELVFRVLLFGGLWLALKTWLKGPIASAIIAAVISSLLFSAIHHIGPLGDSWEAYVFMYRTISGLLFAGMYVLRGFGVTALTHALYDVWIALGVV